MIDWTHIGELVFSGLLTAGAAYGAIKAELRALHDRIDRVEKDIRSESARIDRIIMHIKGN